MKKQGGSMPKKGGSGSKSGSHMMPGMPKKSGMGGGKSMPNKRCK